LAIVGLVERAGDRAEKFSGGMKRRLNIAAGLLHEPKLLVLDEPTVGVDPQSRHAILTTVRELAQEGLAVLYTTHYMEEAERLCDRVGIIDEGRLVAEGTRAELVARMGERDRLRIAVAGDAPALAAACRTMDGGVEVTVGPLAPLGRRPRRRGRRRRDPELRGHRARPRSGVPAPHGQGVAGLTTR
jgi:ABC-2 type transport system ATP-binding protein